MDLGSTVEAFFQVEVERAFRDEEDHSALVEDRDPHPGAELESLASPPRENQLILAGQRYRLHRLTEILSIIVL